MITDGQYITYGSQLNQRQTEQLIRPKRRLFRRVVIPQECQLISLDDRRIQILTITETPDEHLRMYNEQACALQGEIKMHKKCECDHYAGASPSQLDPLGIYRYPDNLIGAMECLRIVPEKERLLQKLNEQDNRYKSLLYSRSLDATHIDVNQVRSLLEQEHDNSEVKHIIAKYLLDERVIELAACLELELSEEVRVECGNKLLEIALAARRQLAEVRKAIREHREFELEVARDTRATEKLFASQSNALVGDMIARETLDKYV